MFDKLILFGTPPSDSDDWNKGEYQEALENLKQELGSEDDCKYKVTTDSSEDDDPEENYKCSFCQQTEYIDDHQPTTPNWCDGNACNQIRTFERIKDE